MDIRKIKKLIELLEESGVAEIEIKEGEESLRISRMSKGVQVSAGPIAPPATPIAPAAPLSAPSAPAATATTAGADEQIVTAPMVGTYYSSPSPGAKEFINLGDEIKAGQ